MCSAQLFELLPRRQGKPVLKVTEPQLLKCSKIGVVVVQESMELVVLGWIPISFFLSLLTTRCTKLQTANTPPLYSGCLYIFVFQNTWNEGLKLAGLMKFKFPTMVSTDISSLIPNASVDGIQLINQMLAWDPQSRITTTQV